ncbi:MAG: LysE family transporter [Xanthomonadaceae bacterium]|nr:LysE family transporter [Xanthomonadaceae bacterium]MDE1962505.1 LysE family transporter [Xanthomonadaceae bacterium]
MGNLLTIAVVHLLALASPGPDFLFVSQTAASRSRAQAMAGVAGITLGIAVWAALALLGLHLLMARLAWLQRAVAIAGSAYLIWLGVQLLRSARRRPGGAGVARLAPDAWRSLRNGLFTNLSNPKALVYFGSVFSVLVGPAAGVGVRWTIGALVVGETLGWFALVALCFGLPAVRRVYLRMARGIDAVAGTVFVLFGLRLLLGARPG